jgi:hypothetical protein
VLLSHHQLVRLEGVLDGIVKPETINDQLAPGAFVWPTQCRKTVGRRNPGCIDADCTRRFVFKRVSLYSQRKNC